MFAELQEDQWGWSKSVEEAGSGQGGRGANPRVLRPCQGSDFIFSAASCHSRARHFTVSKQPWQGVGTKGASGETEDPPPTRGGCADVRRECFLSRPNPKPGSQMYTQNLKKSDSNSWARALSLQGTPGLLCALAGIARHCLNSHHPQPQRTLLCRWLRRPVAWVLGPGHQTPVNSVSSNSHGASGGHPHSYAGALRRTSPACPPALI